MRRMLLGMFCGMALTAIAWQMNGQVNGQAPGQTSGVYGNDVSGSLLVVPLAAQDSAQNMAVVDTQSRVMGIYAVDQATGRVRLTSVRRFRWDLLLDEYNGVEPTAKEIKALIENH